MIKKRRKTSAGDGEKKRHASNSFRGGNKQKERRLHFPLYRRPIHCERGWDRAAGTGPAGVTGRANKGRRRRRRAPRRLSGHVWHTFHRLITRV